MEVRRLFQPLLNRGDYELFILLLIVAVIAVSQETRPVGIIARLVQSAKRQGKTEITDQVSDTNFRPNATTLKMALIDTTVVLAKPLLSKVTVGEDVISTWTKYEVIQYVSRQLPLDYDALPEVTPRELLPIQPNELVLLDQGGTATVDGIQITQMWKGHYEDLLSRPLQMIFLYLRNGGQTGQSAYGVRSFFSVSSGAVHPMSGLPPSSLAKELTGLTTAAVETVKTLASKK